MSNKERKGHFFHVTHDRADNNWHVKEVKGNEITTHKTQGEAIKKAEAMAKKIEMGHVVIHDENGRFKTIENF